MRNLISYPGLSAELVIDKNFNCKQFFEIVASCGVFCRLPKMMQVNLLKTLKKYNQEITGIIFVTDRNNKEKIQGSLQTAKIKAEVVTFNIAPEYNSYGLRINRSVFTDAEKFRRLTKRYPDHLVLVSTPYSCPDLFPYVTNQDTIANRSTLFFFENKKIYSNKFKSELNFVTEIGVNNFNRLSDIIEQDDSQKQYFLKPLGDYVGGTSVIPINKTALVANQKLIEKLISQETYYLFKQLDASNIVSKDGEHYGTQFRPFIDNGNELAGFAVKFSAAAVKQSRQQTSLKRLNATYNSSSGTAISIIFECDSSIQPKRIALSKNNTSDDPEIIKKFIDNLKFNNQSLNDPKTLLKIADALQPKMKELINFFNNFFFRQNWDVLYKKFITDKTYFNN